MESSSITTRAEKKGAVAAEAGGPRFESTHP